jgi:hypothetical protein
MGNLRLIDEIASVDFREFWWGSELLERASRVRDVRVVQALALRHHGLSNKDAFSAHVLRNALKMIDAPIFPFSWSIIDAESDNTCLIRGLDDFSYAPWAVAYILGEIGGHGALRGASIRLRPEHSVRHYMIVRLISHLLVRYLKIQAYKPPTTTMIDVNTGEMTRGLPIAENSPQHKMEMLRRSQADELFSPIDPALIQDLRKGLASIPDRIFNMPREDFFAALDQVPTRHA